MEYPKISIVTPSYNDARFLGATIRSVLDQGYPNLEYIVIDGGSTDGSVEIIKEFTDRLSYWISEKDKGMYYAIQKGFERTTGEIMGWINSDDMLHPGSLFTIGQIFGDFSQINWLQGFPNTVDVNGRIVYLSPPDEVDKLFFYERKHDRSYKYIQQESTYWRRPLWEKAGSHVTTAYKHAGDFDLWIRFFQFERLYNVNAFIGSFRLSSGGQASTDHYKDYVAETFKILEAFPLTRQELRALKYRRLFEKLEHWLFAIKWRTKKLFGAEHTSVYNRRIIFENKTQKFRM